MKKILSILLLLLIFSQTSEAKDFCKRFPTDTAIECYTPTNPPPGTVTGTGVAGQVAYWTGTSAIGGFGAWDNSKLSLAFGLTTTATGTKSLAFGEFSDAQGEGSFAGGLGGVSNHNIASGDGSFAYGNDSVASNYTAVAIGHTTRAAGDKSIAIGDNVTATNTNAYSFGYTNDATGLRSMSLGNNVITSDTDGTSLGNNLNNAGNNTTMIGSGFGSSIDNSLLLGVDVLGMTIDSAAVRSNIDFYAFNQVYVGDSSTVRGILSLWSSADGAYQTITADDGEMNFSANVAFSGYGHFATGISATTGDFNSYVHATDEIEASNFYDQNSNAFFGTGAAPNRPTTQNTSIGSGSLNNLTAGQDNTSVGFDSCFSGATMSGMFCLGTYAGYGAQSGSGQSIFVGYDSMGGNANGVVTDVVAIGRGTYNHGTGSSLLVCLGTGACGDDGTVDSRITTGSTDTFLGAESGANSAPTVTNATGVGYQARVTASNSMQLGNGSVTLVNTSGFYRSLALTASQLVGTDSNKSLVSLATSTYPSLTELSYVKGVTSAIQTQINTKGAGTVTSITAGTGLTGGAITTSGTINSSAVEHLSYQPGLLTAVNSTIGVYYKASKASTVDNLIGSAVTFSCIANPTITMYECGTSTTCASSPVTIGTVTVTAAGTATVGTVSNSAVTAGDYIGFAMTAGTCASIDVAVNAQLHSN